MIQLPFYEGDPLFDVVRWLKIHDFIHYSTDSLDYPQNAKLDALSACVLLRSIRDAKLGYQGWLIDGISFKRKIWFSSDVRTEFPKDVDFYIDIRTQDGESINFDKKLTVMRDYGSPHSRDDPMIILNQSYLNSFIYCAAIIFESGDARETCYKDIHPVMDIEMISRNLRL